MLLDLVTEVLFGIRRNRLTVDEFLWTVLLDTKIERSRPWTKASRMGLSAVAPSMRK